MSHRSVSMPWVYSCGIARSLNKNAVPKNVVTLIRIDRYIIGK
ncbi:hypothetical protein FB99_25250 [Pantoea agglomerans]|nr:hypothetical protein FB99_25250 [Pantoea agglomerans]